MMEAMAQTNSPEDQPAFEDLSDLFNLMVSLPVSGEMSELSPETYEKIISMARAEILKK